MSALRLIAVPQIHVIPALLFHFSKAGILARQIKTGFQSASNVLTLSFLADRTPWPRLKT